MPHSESSCIIIVTVQHPLNLPQIARIYTEKAKTFVRIRGICGKKECEASVSRVVPERLLIIGNRSPLMVSGLAFILKETPE